MPGFGSGFLTGFTDAAKTKIDQNHTEQEQRNTELRNGLWKIAYDPNQPEAVRQNAQEQLQKLYPNQKKGLEKFSDIFHDFANKLSGSQQAGQGQPTPQGGGLATPQTPAPQSGATPTPTGPPPQLAMPQTPAPSAAQASQGASPGVVSAQLATPKTPAPAPQQFQLPPAPTDAQLSQPTALDQRQLNMAQAERDRRQKTGTAMGLSGRDLAEFTESGKMPAGGAPGTRRAEKWELPDGSKVDIDYDPKLGARYTADGQIWDPPTGAKRTDKAVNLQLAWFKFPGDPDNAPPHAVRVDPRDPSKALDQATGKQVPEGATQINTGIVEQQIRQNSYGQFGNLFRAIKGAHPEMSDEQASNLAGQQVEADYQKRLSLMGAGSIHEALGVDANGNQVAVPLQTTRVPGAGGPTAPSVPGSAPQVTPSVSPKAAPSAAPVTPKIAPASAAPAGGALSPRLLGAVTPAQARQSAQFAVPITESVVQMFGDPSQPNLKPLAGFGHIADDPNASKRIGKAIQLTMNGFGEGIGNASIGAGAGPIHLSAGGFGDWLQNELNVPGAVAQQKADIIRQSIQALTPEEREAYDATMAELSVMAGLRSLNKSSAAQGSIRLIENEIPKLGINVANSKQFYDQLQKVAGAIGNAVNAPGLIPKVKDSKTGEQMPVGLSSDMLKRIKGLSDEMQKKKDAASVSPKGKASLKSPGNVPKNADQYLQSIGVQ